MRVLYNFLIWVFSATIIVVLFDLIRPRGLWLVPFMLLAVAVAWVITWAVPTIWKNRKHGP
jgi:hypothetical protein